MRTPFVLALSVIALAGISGGAHAAPPPGSINLGGVNLKYWCQVTFGQNYVARLLGNTAGDWRCVISRPRGGAGAKSISVQDACRVQYGRSGLIAYALNWGDPLSWRCFQPRRGGSH
ncbi:MAG: hypothetical protein ACTHOR_03850 [Devosia sp.]|jgi:hypothetical protein